MAPRGSFVHPTAVIEPGAVVGEGTAIWHHAHVRRGSVIGTDCVLGKNVFIDEGVLIGDRVKIQNNVSVYRGVELDDEVFVGPSAVFTNDARPRAGNHDWQLSPTKVRRGASLGANSTIVCGLEIGERAMVAAGTVVTRPVRPHQVVAGNPARHHGWVCDCGDVVWRAEARPADLKCPNCPADLGSGAPADPGQRSRVTLVQLMLGQEEQDAVLSVLRSGHLAAGKWVRELESAFALAHDAAHAVAVSNGTVALIAALQAHRIGPGDEVITSPLTFVATLNAILAVGATARFADVSDDLTLDPSAVAALVTPRTRALMPIHLYGLPAAMPELSALAREHGLVVIEDAAQAHGAQVAGSPVGSTGTAAFSFYATKNITCGEGGIVTTGDDDIAGRLRLLRNHGMRDRYDYTMPGYNYRLTDLQAAIAAVQVSRLPDIAVARRRQAALLSAGLSGVPGIVLPACPADRMHAWHQYTIQVGSHARVDRDQLRKCLDAAGIDTMAYYPRLVHDYPCYDDRTQVVRDDTPRAARAAMQVLSLPVHPALTGADIDRIVVSVRSALD